jgi:catechol 2,3-dioxygenase-like lactoylglutathione lyase family enzyme
MLANHDAVAMIAVKDLPAARRFYEGVLGLEVVDAEGQDLLVFRSGGTVVNVYRSQYAGTNRATTVMWAVGDELDGLVERLKAKGVPFEHYDMPGMTREGEVHVGGPMGVAWFKDPDGNILSIVNGRKVGRASHRKTGKTTAQNGSGGGAGAKGTRRSAGRASRAGGTSKAGRG